MPFMEPQADYFSAFHVETSHGTEIIPTDLVGNDPEPSVIEQFLEGNLLRDAEGGPDIEMREGWYSRFSAPGYMDRTDWGGPHETAEEAFDALAETWDVCRECWEQCWDSDSPCEEGA